MSEQHKLDWDYHMEGWMAHRRKEAVAPPAQYDDRGQRWWKRGWRDRAEEVSKGDGRRDE